MSREDAFLAALDRKRQMDQGQNESGVKRHASKDVQEAQARQAARIERNREVQQATRRYAKEGGKGGSASSNNERRGGGHGYR